MKLKQNGFSMVEILIAAGLIGVLAIGGARLFELQNKGTKSIEQKYDLTVFVNEIRSMLTVEANCSANFSGHGLPYTTVSLVNAGGDVLYTVGTKIKGFNNLELVSISMGAADLGLPGFQSVSGNAKNGIVPLVLNIKKVGDTYGAETIKKLVKLNVRLAGPGGNVTSCNAYSVGGFGFWNPAGSGDGIFYDSGFVGAYTTDPKAIFQIGSQIDIHTPVLSVNAQDIQGRTGVDGRAAMRIKAGSQADGTPSAALIIHQANGDALAKFSGGGNIEIGPQIGGFTPLLSINSQGIANITSGVSGTAAVRIQGSNASDGTPGKALVIHQANGTPLTKFSSGGNIEIGPQIGGFTPLLSINSQGIANITSGVSGTTAVRIQGSNASDGTPGSALVIHQANGTPLIKFSSGGNIQIGDQFLGSTPLLSLNAEAVANVRPDIPGIVAMRVKGAAASNVAVFHNASDDVLFKVDETDKTSILKGLSVTGKAGLPIAEFINSSNIKQVDIAANGDVTLEKNIDVKGTTRLRGAVTADGNIVAANFNGNVQGNVSGNASSADFALHANTCGSLSPSSSDRNLKRDIRKIEDALDKLSKISGNTFLWRNKKEQKRREFGVIAQEIREVFPDLVFEDSKGMLSVKYEGLIAPLIEGLKESNDKIKDLELKVEENNKLIERLLLKLEKNDHAEK